MRNLTTFLKLGSVLIVVLFALVSLNAVIDNSVDYEVSTEGLDVPRFRTVDLPFVQNNDFTTAHPFAAGAIIDIDNDGTEELFLGGGPGQRDVLLSYESGSFSVIERETGITKSNAAASTAAVVIDADGNGWSDIIVTRSDGVWLHSNQGGVFDTQKLPLELPAYTTPLSVAIADLNRDGHLDLYVAGYIRIDLVEGQNIFNKKGYGGSSYLFLNRGDNTFTDITEQAGLSYRHNTFMGLFVDIDADGLEDLVVAHDTGQVRTWKNEGELRFSLQPNPSSEQFSYPMGIAVGDYNNDLRVDLAFSNVGSTPPNFLIRGDLTDAQISNWKWMLFENKGEFRFEDSAATAKIADYEFSWGLVMEDINLDGREDLIVSENYIGLPPQKLPIWRAPGRLLLQTVSGEFAAVGAEAGVVNRRFSISPLVADFNGDGYPDIVHVNLNGQSRAFLSEGGEAGYLNVRLPDRISSIGATATLSLSDGSRQIRYFTSGEGLCADSSHVLSFGLGKHSAVQVSIQFLDGTQEQRSGAFRNELLSF